MGDCQSSWHTSSHRTTISIRMFFLSPVEQIIAPRCTALCIMCGIWCFLPTMNLCRKVVCWPVGCNRTDSFLKQRGLLYLHLYNLVNLNQAFLAIAKDNNPPRFKMVLHIVRKCDNVPVCNCTGRD